MYQEPNSQIHSRQNSIDKLLSLYETTDVLERSRQINGRTFHNLEDQGIRYFLPQDRIELDRMETLHYLTKIVWESNYSAPVKDLLNTTEMRVLDVACGGGNWVKDLASEHLPASFIGTDLSPIFVADANSGNKPLNAAFLECNTLDGLPFEDDTFDFVHQRSVAIMLTGNQWKDTVIPELVRVLKPGGFIELHEVQTVWERMGPVTTTLIRAATEMMRSRGINPSVIDHFEEDLESTGELVEITRKQVPMPIGEWGGKLGEFFKFDRMKVGESTKTYLAAYMKINHEEFDEMLQRMSEEVNEYKSYVMSVRVHARKISKVSSPDSGIGTL